MQPPRNTQPSRFIPLAALALSLHPGAGSADAPPGHFEIKGEVAEDTATGLTWQRVAAAESFSSARASRYCSGLGLAGGGWRMPTLKELHTLIDETKTLPAVDEEAFPKTPSAFFWSSSTLVRFPQYAWSVNFADGTDAWFPDETPQRVRCVR